DLRRNIDVDAKVTTMTYDEVAHEWTTETEAGHSIKSQFVITALGILSEPLYPDVPGLENFKGRAFHTARWPAEPLDFSGKRVAVVGSAASAVQLLPIVAE